MGVRLQSTFFAPPYMHWPFFFLSFRLLVKFCHSMILAIISCLGGRKFAIMVTMITLVSYVMLQDHASALQVYTHRHTIHLIIGILVTIGFVPIYEGSQLFITQPKSTQLLSRFPVNLYCQKGSSCKLQSNTATGERAYTDLSFTIRFRTEHILPWKDGVIYVACFNLRGTIWSRLCPLLMQCRLEIFIR